MPLFGPLNVQNMRTSRTYNGTSSAPPYRPGHLIQRAAVLIALILPVVACSQPPGETAQQEAPHEGLLSTVSPTPETQPGEVASPAGRIAFDTIRDGNWEIYVMDADGSHQTNLTNHPGYDREPTWSPDGDRIAFVSNRQAGLATRQIFVMNADGSGQTGLTDNLLAVWNFLYPAWSPDGAHIAFSSNHIDNLEIYLMALDGADQTHLTEDDAPDFDPAWSPDGSQIAFVSERDGNRDIYVMAADGSGTTRLTDDPGSDLEPAWSPDGTQIAFLSNRGGYMQIYVMNVDGTGQTLLTDFPASHGGAAWSPDGLWIAFHATRDDPDPADCGDNCNWEIYVMRSDGSSVIRLTTSPVADMHPAWQP